MEWSGQERSGPDRQFVDRQERDSATCGERVKGIAQTFVEWLGKEGLGQAGQG